MTSLAESINDVATAIQLALAPVFLLTGIEVMLDAPLKWLIGALFTAATLALVVDLAFFLREVHMATRITRIPIRGRDPTRRTHLPRDEA